MLLSLYMQDPPEDFMSNISYTLFFTGSVTRLNFTTADCNSTTNICTLRVNGSDLSPNDTYNLSVVATNIVGDGAPAMFTNKGLIILV